MVTAGPYGPHNGERVLPSQPLMGRETGCSAVVEQRACQGRTDLSEVQRAVAIDRGVTEGVASAAKISRLGVGSADAGTGAVMGDQATMGPTVGAGDGSDPAQVAWASRLSELRQLRAEINSLLGRIDVLADITLAGPRLASPSLRLVQQGHEPRPESS
jgi:hypothetical protein